MRTLRGRLILSHILPLLLVLPLVSVVLIYIVESQILLDNISNELTRGGTLTAELALSQPEIWTDSAEAQQFVLCHLYPQELASVLYD